MDCTTTTSSLPTIHQLGLPNSRDGCSQHPSSSQNTLPVLSLASSSSTCLNKPKATHSRLRKVTGYSRILSAAFALGERCRNALWRGQTRGTQPLVATASLISLPIQVSNLSEATQGSHSNILVQTGTSDFMDGLEETSITPSRLSYNSLSFVTVTYTDSDSARSSFDSELSFCCRGLSYHEVDVEDLWDSNDYNSRVNALVGESF